MDEDNMSSSVATKSSSSDMSSVKSLKSALHGWREICVIVNRVLRWEQPYHPAVIFGVTTAVFTFIWWEIFDWLNLSVSFQIFQLKVHVPHLWIYSWELLYSQLQSSFSYLFFQNKVAPINKKKKKDLITHFLFFTKVHGSIFYHWHLHVSGGGLCSRLHCSLCLTNAVSWG